MTDICPLKLIGAMGALCGALALRMSFYRLAGSPGEGEEDSCLTKCYWCQQLTTEWFAIGTPLMLAVYLKKPKGTLAKVAGISNLVFTATRFTFAGARLFLPKEHQIKVGFPSMLGTYAATFAFAGILLNP
jgi:hypothetical protein